MGGGRRRQPGVGQGARSFLLSSDEDEGSGVSDTLYLYGAIDAALQRECDYAAAVDELEQLLRSGVYHRNFSKPAQAAVQKSLFLAVVKCTRYIFSWAMQLLRLIFQAVLRFFSFPQRCQGPKLLLHSSSDELFYFLRKSSG